MYHLVLSFICPHILSSPSLYLPLALHLAPSALPCLCRYLASPLSHPLLISLASSFALFATSSPPQSLRSISRPHQPSNLGGQKKDLLVPEMPTEFACR
jgi:hypothetical protein